LDQRGEQGSAQRADDAGLYVTGIGDDDDDAEKFSLLEDGQRIDVEGGILNSNKIAGWRANFPRAESFGRRLIESHGKSRGDAADGAGRIVDSDAAEAFAGHITVEKVAESFRSDFVTRGFDSFRDVFRDDSRASGQFVSQIPAFGADLEKGIAERYAGDADGQWQDKIQSPSHFRSS